MSLKKLPMTDKSKKAIAIASIITVFLALVIILFIIIQRIKNKQKYLLQVFAENDLKIWKGKTETNLEVSEKLIEYWKTVGFKVSKSDLQSTEFQSKYPWSAAYISNLVLRSGFENFKGRATHAAYSIDAKNNRNNKLKKSFWAFKPEENKKIEIGDILVANRGTNSTFDTITNSTPTHGDIVVGFEKKHGKIYAIAQGGNLSNTVQTRLFLLNPDYTLPKPYKHIIHLKYIQ
jgi:hypothetical protein